MLLLYCTYGSPTIPCISGHPRGCNESPLWPTEQKQSGWGESFICLTEVSKVPRIVHVPRQHLQRGHAYGYDACHYRDHSTSPLCSLPKRMICWVFTGPSCVSQERWQLQVVMILGLVQHKELHTSTSRHGRLGVPGNQKNVARVCRRATAARAFDLRANAKVVPRTHTANSSLGVSVTGFHNSRRLVARSVLFACWELKQRCC